MPSFDSDKAIELTSWTVEYCLPEGATAPRAVEIPHAWRQEVDVRWEGPAVYRTKAKLPLSAWLIFEGVSYQTRVFVNEETVGEHRGIWDAFAIDIRNYSGQEVEIRVEVIKSGGASFPVKDVLSGFLPYVFNTFGGIYKPVRILSSNGEPNLNGKKLEKCRIRAEGTKLLVNDKPFFVRGVLTWGWYPEIGHTNPDIETIRKEIEIARSIGFNLIKFCLWLPSHEYLDEMEKAGLAAWIELPLWDPTGDSAKLDQMKNELERIVLQYRHHPNILLWTCGCELSEATPHEYRKSLYEMVDELTGNPMVKDNSGGSEMYGGDPREYGAFYDYHPYCDLQFFLPVLESLQNGPREKKPILLGETCDYDTHRDLARIRKERPYWASSDPALNDVGVRWQHDLPRVIEESRFALEPDTIDCLDFELTSESKSSFQRSKFHDWALNYEDIAGYVVTGWADTPISSSGFIDPWGRQKSLLILPSNEDFQVPLRRPPWVNGGNRPGWQDESNFFCGKILLRASSASDVHKNIDNWSLTHLHEGGRHLDLIRNAEPWISGNCIEFELELNAPGIYWIAPDQPQPPPVPYIYLHVVEEVDWGHFENWRIDDQHQFFSGTIRGIGANLITTRANQKLFANRNEGNHVVLFALDDFTIPMPFWRECIHEVPNPRPWLKPFEDYNWHQILPVSTDRALDREALEAELGMNGTVLLNRIDTRTYAEHPYAMEFDNGKSKFIVTTIRPFGGLGICPWGLKNNPAGSYMVATLLEELDFGSARA